MPKVDSEVKELIRACMAEKCVELDLSGRGLTELPGSIGSLTHLRTLNLGDNRLSVLPHRISRLQALEDLDLSSNAFSTLPPIITKLEHLSEVDISSNTIDFLPGDIGFLSRLTTLRANNNRLIDLPHELSRISSLEVCELRRNQLSDVPSWFCQFRKLRVLDLSINAIRRVSDCIQNLGRLETCLLNGNRLRELPGTIGQLPNIQLLDVSDNQMSSLPSSFDRLLGHAEVRFGGNPVTFPPPEILAQGTESTIAFLRRYQRDPRGQDIHEAKMLVLGEGEVGKTCLMKRLIFGTFDGSEDTTHGISIAKWTFPSPVDPKNLITLNVWDFGGQEVYRSTHQFFLTLRSLYVLVWDARHGEEYAKLEFWLRTIESFGGDSPILIVMNKCDQWVQELNMADLKQRFPQIVGSHKVSCKTGDGIDALSEDVKRVAATLPLMGVFWFNSWLAVRQQIEHDTRNQVEYSEFLTTCENNGIGTAEAAQLSRYLHDLGVILHFHSDVILKDTGILKPEWGTRAVYCVMESHEVVSRSGLLKVSELPGIWGDCTVYPPAKYGTLLRLMENFELAFPLEGHGEYVIPECLPQCPLTIDWYSQCHVAYEYRYGFLPKGIMTRFVVRVHNFIFRAGRLRLCWKDGAYLRTDNGFGVVRQFPMERRIEVRLGGHVRDILALVRGNFSAIHASIPKIDVKEMVPCCCSDNCPHRFDYRFLTRLDAAGHGVVMCENSVTKVRVRRLLDGVQGSEPGERGDCVRQTIRIEKFQGVLGDVTNSQLSQDLVMEVAPGDMAGLRRLLERMGIERGDLHELEAALRSDPKPTNRSLGPRVTDVLSSMIQTVASGTSQLSLGTAGSLIANAIWAYYGL